MKVNLRDMTKKFLLGESKSTPSLSSYIQSLTEILNSFNPKTKTEGRRIEIAKEQLGQIKKQTRVLTERVSLLEERLNILEEGMEDDA